MKVPIRGSARRRGPVRHAWLGAVSALVLAPALAVATAGAASAATGTASTATPDAYGSAQLPINMQVQQQNEWCWVASGDTIASYLGHGTDQNSFCDLAHGYPTSYSCPNQAGYLSYDQRAFSALGISPGTETGAVPFSTIVSNIDAGHPIQTGISWTAGGGHSEVIYGYDSSGQQIFWGDPWPSDQRLNEGSYSYYRSNYSFVWNDSLSQIGA